MRSAVSPHVALQLQWWPFYAAAAASRLWVEQQPERKRKRSHPIPNSGPGSSCKYPHRPKIYVAFYNALVFSSISIEACLFQKCPQVAFGDCRNVALYSRHTHLPPAELECGCLCNWSRRLGFFTLIRLFTSCSNINPVSRSVRNGKDEDKSTFSSYLKPSLHKGQAWLSEQSNVREMSWISKIWRTTVHHTFIAL